MIRTKKTLGQHFLTSSAVVEYMAEAAHITAADTVLEIGPGTGILTKTLLERGARVIAVEKDDRLIPLLHEHFASFVSAEKLTIIHGDILTADLSSFISSPYKVVANIPYYITGQIFRLFLEHTHQPQSMTLLVQKEVAERIIARDGKENLLSLSVKAFGNPALVRVVKKGSFNPPPKVDSAIIHIDDISRHNFSDTDENIFFALIHAGFAHKRKQLMPNLAALYEKNILSDVFLQLSIPLHVRAEDVSLPEWLSLARALPQLIER